MNRIGTSRLIRVHVSGLSCQVPLGTENILTAKYEAKERVYGGRNNGRFKTVTYSSPVYTRNGSHIECGFGALMFLAINNPFVHIEFTILEPKRQKLSKIEVPEEITLRPYQVEALEACRRNYMGVVRLPPGAGKTVVELTLAYNLMRQL